MTKSCVSSMSLRKKLVTYCTVNYVVMATCLGTVRKNYVLCNCISSGVAKCGNNGLIKDLTAIYTLVTVGKTGCGTACILGGIPLAELVVGIQ